MYRFYRGILLIVLGMSLWACPQGAGLPAAFDQAATANDSEGSNSDENFADELDGSADVELGGIPTGELDNTHTGINNIPTGEGEPIPTGAELPDGWSDRHHDTTVAADDRTSTSPSTWEKVDPENVRIIRWPPEQRLPWNNSEQFFEMVESGSVPEDIARQARCDYRYLLIREEGVIYTPISEGLVIEESEIVTQVHLYPGYHLIFVTKDHQPYRYGNLQRTFANLEQFIETVKDPHSRFLGERRVVISREHHLIPWNREVFQLQDESKTKSPINTIEEFYTP